MEVWLTYSTLRVFAIIWYVLKIRKLVCVLKATMKNSCCKFNVHSTYIVHLWVV